MANKKNTKKKTNKKPVYNKKGVNKKSGSKKGMVIAIAVTVVVIAALAIVLTLALGGKSDEGGRKLLKSDAKHVTVTGEQRLLQLCDKVQGGIAYTETYETDGMINYYTCDGVKNYNRATFTDESYSWDVAEMYDGATGYAVDHSNKIASKFETDYNGIFSLSMMGVYVALRDANNLTYVSATEEKFEGKKCYVETYAQTSSLTGENTIKAYFYEDTLVAIVTENQYKTLTDYVELTEGADTTCLTYEKLEGYTENF